VLGGLFKNQWQGDDDFGLIASRVAEQLANTNAASTSERQKKVDEIAKRPQPIKSVTVTHKPDGTMDQVVTVKNAPQQDPAEEAQAAGAAPQSEYLQHVAAPIIHGGAATISALPDPEAIDPSLLADRKGREKLLKDSGLDAAFEHKPGEGLLGMAARLDKRDELLNNPDLLKRLVMAQRFRQRAAIADQVRPFNEDANAADREQRQQSMEARQNVAEARRQSTEARREEETFIGDFTRGDHNYGFMDDKGASTLIDAEKQRYKARFGADKEMPGWMETMMRSRIMDDRAKNASDQSKTQFQHDNQDRNYDRLMETLGIQTANTQSMIAGPRQEAEHADDLPPRCDRNSGRRAPDVRGGRRLRSEVRRSRAEDERERSAHREEQVDRRNRNRLADRQRDGEERTVEKERDRRAHRQDQGQSEAHRRDRCRPRDAPEQGRGAGDRPSPHERRGASEVEGPVRCRATGSSWPTRKR
jgi:hypothetical protein